MQIAAAFPSDFLKAADLQGRQVKVTIDRVEMRDIGDDHKPVVFFQGKERGLVLNKTNANMIEEALGGETDHWHGRQITLYPTKVDFQGKRVDAIRVMAVAVMPPLQTPAVPSSSPQVLDGDVSDEIPF